jgi:hypothetical protein
MRPKHAAYAAFLLVLLAVGLAGALGPSARSAPPCWSNSPNRPPSCFTTTTTTTSTTVPTTTTTTTAPPPILGDGTGIIRLGGSWSSATGYNRYSYVIAGPSNIAQAAAQPGISLIYRSVAQLTPTTATNDESFLGCVSVQDARANGWILKDASGNEIITPSYGDPLADIGSDGYRQACATRVAAFLKSYGAKGVFFDDATADSLMVGGLTSRPPKYPTAQAWEDAMVGFFATVGQSLKAQGLYVAANAPKWIAGDGGSDTGALTAGFWQRLAPSVSGLMNEYFVQNPNNLAQLRLNGPEWYNNWAGWQSLVSVAQNAGADFLGLTAGACTETRSMTYGRASFLLDWDGAGGAFFYDCPGDPWNVAWTENVGVPTGAKQQLTNGVWERTYSGATVYVNPTASTQTADGHTLGSGTAFIG